MPPLDIVRGESGLPGARGTLDVKMMNAAGLEVQIGSSGVELGLRSY